VLNPVVVSYTLKSFEQHLLRGLDNHVGETSVLEKKIVDLERKIRNCTSAIAEGHAFKSLLDRLGFLETERQQAKLRLETMKPEGVRVRIRETQRFVVAGLSDLRELLNREPRLARTVLAKHIRKIVLRPQKSAYLAVGDWNLLGLGSYGGAGGPVATERHIPFTIKVAACEASASLFKGFWRAEDGSLKTKAAGTHMFPAARRKQG
jgi:hypothetical protein